MIDSFSVLAFYATLKTSPGTVAVGLQGPETLATGSKFSRSCFLPANCLFLNLFSAFVPCKLMNKHLCPVANWPTSLAWLSFEMLRFSDVRGAGTELSFRKWNCQRLMTVTCWIKHWFTTLLTVFSLTALLAPAGHVYSPFCAILVSFSKPPALTVAPTVAGNLRTPTNTFV